MSPVGCWMKSNCAPEGPAAPPACWKPGIPGGMKCVARPPARAPPRVFRSASRSDAAITALRMLMLLNGGLLCVQRDVAVTADRRQRQLLRILRRRQLQRLSGGGEVEVDHARSGQDLGDGGVRVREALLDDDLVDVRRAEVGARGVVRVAHQHDLLARLVARDVVRTDVDLMLAVRRGRRLRVVLRRVPLRDRRVERQRQRVDHADRRRLGQVEHDRRRVRGRDAR